MSLPAWLADPGLQSLWRTVHEQLERRGPDWRGRATVDLHTEAERRALGLLLGRVVDRDRVTVDVQDLDERLTTAGGLENVLVAAVGSVQDRRSVRAIAESRREAPVRAARAELLDVEWAEEWFAFVRRAAPTSAEAAAAAGLLGRLLATHEGVSRQDLAAGCTGDAHALDDGTALAALVLRGLALACGAAPAETAGQRRELWGSAGVRLDGVSTTCLVLRLPLLGALEARVADGEPLHLTARDLRRAGVALRSPTTVLVCENPRVLEAIADAELDVAVVCSSGSPNLVVMDVLSALSAGGSTLLYHGDFDWPGVAIANRLVMSVGVQPWLMTADAYEVAAGSSALPLSGRPVEALWDTGLAEVMRRQGKAVHEEAVLPFLLESAALFGQ